MLRQRKPLRRVSPKRFLPKGEWRPQVKRATPSEMHELRSQAFARSGGKCECKPSCTKAVNWFSGDLHHVIRRGKGGSDTLDNLIFVHRDHHRNIHGKLQWSKPT